MSQTRGHLRLIHHWVLWPQTMGLQPRQTLISGQPRKYETSTSRHERHPGLTERTDFAFLGIVLRDGFRDARKLAPQPAGSSTTSQRLASEALPAVSVAPSNVVLMSIQRVDEAPISVALRAVPTAASSSWASTITPGRGIVGCCWWA